MGTRAPGWPVADATRLPILTSLHGYRAAWLGPDLIAGLTLVAVAIPEQMATAQLAGMPVQTGLYAFIAAGLAIALIGSSRQLSVGADSTIAPIFAAGIVAVGAAGTPEYRELVALLALLVGAILVVVGLLRMGWLADLLSTPVTTGFLAGIGITIIVGQLPEMLGVAKGSGGPLEQLLALTRELGAIQPAAVAIAAAVFAIVLVSERIDPRIPGALIGLVVSILAVAVFGLRSQGLAVLGILPAGLPPLAIPSLSAGSVAELAPLALVVALVCLIQTSAASRSFAEIGGYSVDLDRDFLAVGVGSAASSLLGGFPVNASPPRTAVVAQSGGRSQVASLVAVAVVIATLGLATGLLEDLPKATLGAVLAFVGTRIIRLGDLRRIARYDRRELGLALFTLLAVALVGVEAGVGVAIALAILERTWISARPRVRPLGRVPGTTLWVPSPGHVPLEQVPGVVAVFFGAPLYFVNASHFKSSLLRAAEGSSPPCRALVLEAAAVDDVDYTGAAAFREVVAELARDGVMLAVARARLEEMPEHVTPEALGLSPDHVFATVEEAVRALGPAAASGDDAPGRDTPGADEPATAPTAPTAAADRMTPAG